MSIYCLRCDCKGTEGLLRKAMRNGGYIDWMDEPMFVGRHGVDDFERRLSETLKNDSATMAMLEFARTSGTYAIVYGARAGKTIWANVADGDLKSRLDAELIVEKFA